MLTNYKEIIETIIEYVVASDYSEKNTAKEKLVHLQSKLANREKDIRVLAENAVTLSGVPQSLRGYRYCVDALIIALGKNDGAMDITKIIYPEIAKINDTTPGGVERCIRTAVEKSVDRCDPDTYYRIFGNTYSMKSGRPTNKEYINTLTNLIKRQLT